MQKRAGWLCWLGLVLASCAVPMGASDEVPTFYDAAEHADATNGLAGNMGRLAKGVPPAGFDVFSVGEGSHGGGIALPRVPAPDRQLIYTGSIAVEVARPDDAQRQLLARVKEWGGYLAAQQDRRFDVRVPAARFDELLAFARGLGRVLGESRQVADVTDQLQDLALRLDNAKKSRERLLALMAKADKVEDLLKVEEQLRRLTEEIERMEGQQKQLQDKVAMSVISVTLQATAEAPEQPRAARPSRFAWIRALGVERMQEGF